MTARQMDVAKIACALINSVCSTLYPPKQHSSPLRLFMDQMLELPLLVKETAVPAKTDSPTSSPCCTAPMDSPWVRQFLQDSLSTATRLLPQDTLRNHTSTPRQLNIHR